ncbi:MAG: WbqC family protein [Prevotella sp.]|nr:WbqC family protein [Prevotella sp.]
MTTALLATTYFGPIQWYQKLYRYDKVQIECCETFVKQTYRNRCLIATTQGVQALTVPVRSEKLKTPPSLPEGEEQSGGGAFAICSPTGRAGEVSLISDHGNWRHLHWQAMQSAYGDSPFFEYYEDDLRPFFTEHRWERLLDFNEAIRETMCELLDIHPHVEHTTSFLPPTTVAGNAQSAIADFRAAIHPKHPQPDADFIARPYYQVFASKHGFLPNLSILDLLFNMGPESIFFL